MSALSATDLAAYDQSVATAREVLRDLATSLDRTRSALSEPEAVVILAQGLAVSLADRQRMATCLAVAVMLLEAGERP